MARVFIDANILFDLLQRNPEETKNLLDSHQIFLSPLSVHIFCYSYKLKIPNPTLKNLLKLLTLVDITTDITQSSLSGPTADFEDNLQLHSAVAANVDYFLSKDKNLIKPAYFGKMKLVDTLPE